MDIRIFLKAVGKTFEMFSDPKFIQSESSRIGKSDLLWANRKLQPLNRSRHIRQGDVLQFDFGKNLDPEMSYEHRGLVIGTANQLLYVLPIFSYRHNKHAKDVYDKELRPKGNLYLLRDADYAFIKHDSVLKLNDMRTVSTKRILFPHENGHVDIESEVYKEILFLVFSKYFPRYAYELAALRAAGKEDMLP